MQLPGDTVASKLHGSLGLQGTQAFRMTTLENIDLRWSDQRKR